MFGMCGKSAKYEEADLESERKEITDLLKQWKPDPKPEPQINSNNELNKATLLSILLPGMDCDPLLDKQTVVSEQKPPQQTNIGQQIVNQIAAQQNDMSGSIFINQQQMAQSVGNDLDMDEPEMVNEDEQPQQSQVQNMLNVESQQTPAELINNAQPISIVSPDLSACQPIPQQQIQQSQQVVANVQPLQDQVAPQQYNQPQIPVQQQVIAPQPVQQTIKPLTSVVAQAVSQQQVPLIQPQQIAPTTQYQPQQMIQSQQPQQAQQFAPVTTQQQQVQASNILIQPQVSSIQQQPAVEQSYVSQQASNQFVNPSHSLFQSQADRQQSIQSSVVDNSHEVAYLKQQLEQQQFLFKQQMELMKAQQEKIIQQQRSDQETKQLLQQLQQQIQMQQVQYSPIAKNPDYNIYNSQTSPQRKQRLHRYQNAKLSLTSNSLCGFDGNEKLFEINLGTPNIVKFDAINNRIVIQHGDGPIVIKAENEYDYNKWSSSIQKCIESARQGITSKGLVMKLDQQTQYLFVYKGADTRPTKQFNVSNCTVEVRMDQDFATVKVKCVDGRKFSFGDKIPICEQWTQQFKRCGGTIQYM